MSGPSFKQSEALLARALRTIPLGTQTFSKSKTQYPHGVSPYYISRGKGARVWDVDGNEYADFINSLAAVTLGYCDPDVDRAVADMMRNGVVFSLPHPIEIEVAEELVKLIPSAEMVRFGKNGSDATAGAIRVARAFTGRDHVAICGYHGWQDWYVGATLRNKGVPGATRALTHVFRYNDIDSLHSILSAHPGEFAAVILEPMNIEQPRAGFLGEVKELAHRHGALLVFDEVVTGFRLHIGGAQSLFGVMPDLSAFGKGMANGYPVSAVVGRADVMREMEEVFFSFTFGGETLSLAAALATLQKLQREPVIDQLRRTGERVISIVRGLVAQFGLDGCCSVSGHPAWSFLSLRDVGDISMWGLKTLLLQEMFAKGVLTLGTHNISYAHGDEDLERLRRGYEAGFARMREAIDGRPLRELLQCEPIQPLFRVR
jgi:glutamate-1-semialdehyde 2,1-aminomutase